MGRIAARKKKLVENLERASQLVIPEEQAPFEPTFPTKKSLTMELTNLSIGYNPSKQKWTRKGNAAVRDYDTLKSIEFWRVCDPNATEVATMPLNYMTITYNDDGLDNTRRRVPVTLKLCEDACPYYCVTAKSAKKERIARSEGEDQKMFKLVSAHGW